ncbi:MAG: N-acetylglucosamine-6-phosphate deacetylase [Verrucomicrobiota bacterium]
MKPLDLQVNGYAGTDFNSDDLTLDSLHLACTALEEDGVSSILATIITDHIDAMSDRLARIARFREQDDTIHRLIAGFHVEGPFLNDSPGFAGTHPTPPMKPASPDLARRLLDAAQGHLKLLTLAPERDPGFATTRFLTDHNILVAAGHCDPTLDQLRGALDAGLAMFTHLGNGCPVTAHRHDNIIQRALSLDDLPWFSFIPDGIHVPFFALKNYLRLAGIERSIFVTDAIAAARLGPGTFTIGSHEIEVDSDGVAWAANRENFAGSTVTMPQARKNALQHLGMTEQEFSTATAANPRSAIGLS